MTGLADEQVAAPPHDAHRLLFHQGRLRGGVVVVERHQPPLGLGDDLLRHHEDVSAAQRRPVGSGRRHHLEYERRQVRPRR